MRLGIIAAGLALLAGASSGLAAVVTGTGVHTIGPFGTTGPLQAGVGGAISFQAGSGMDSVSGTVEFTNNASSSSQSFTLRLTDFTFRSTSATPVTLQLNIVQDFALDSRAVLSARTSHQFQGSGEFVSALQSGQMSKTSTHEATMLPAISSGSFFGLGFMDFFASHNQFVVVPTDQIYRINATYTFVLRPAGAGVATIRIANTAVDSANLVLGPPPPPPCDTIDFNRDGLFPDDRDLVDFLTVLAGGQCSEPACNDLDFNNDGLFPDDTDLLTFLRVLAGGTCAP